MTSDKQQIEKINVGDRFIDEKGLIHTVKNFKENKNPDYLAVIFDSGLHLHYCEVVEQFFKDCETEFMVMVNMKPFKLEQGVLYITNGGEELEFKVIQDDPDHFAIYVSDQGTDYSHDGQYVVGGPENLKVLDIIGLCNDHVRDVIEQRKLKVTDFVDVEVIELESIPAFSNPHHFDNEKSACVFIHGWATMINSTQPEPLQELVLSNINSGQRFLLRFNKR